MKTKIFSLALGLLVLFSGSCKRDLLEQIDPNKLPDVAYFTNVADATTAVMGVYLGSRTAFYKQYAFDGGSDMMYSKISNRPYSNYLPGNTMGTASATGMGRHWNDLYRGINRANYVIVNVDKMIASGIAGADELKRIKGEASFFRALLYFRLIDLWGDVPFYTNVLNGNDEAYSLGKTSKQAIRDAILSDLDYACANIPITLPSSAQRGRITRVATFAYRGKVKLYWACWAKTAGNASEALTYYQGAIADFTEAMKPIYSRILFKNGDPGTAANPSYGLMFDGNEINEAEMYATEGIFAFTNAGPSFGGSDAQADEFYGDTYLYDFGGRQNASGGYNVAPTIRLVDRYQLIATGGFAPALVPTINTATGARTNVNSTLNPASYNGRDFRCRATIMWDDEFTIAVDANGVLDKTYLDGSKAYYRFGQNAGTVNGLQYSNSDGQTTGYVYRKYVRTTVTGYSREAGPQDSWLMRLPDVWLMYCEAVNEVSGPTPECIGLVNKIRARGGLPALTGSAVAGKATFFDAIEQERIVELAAEGHRFFDIRRWRKAEQLWPAPTGYILRNTWGAIVRTEFPNAIDKDYQKYYIFQIPAAEIIANPKIKQNDPWL